MRPSLTNQFMLLALSSALAFTAACAPAGRNRDRSIDAVLAPGTVTTVMVHNQQPSDMKVYVVAGSAEHRLGLVSAASTATFRIPGVIPTPADVRFVAVPLAGGETQATETITVFAGNAMVFTIGQGAAASSLLIRR